MPGQNTTGAFPFVTKDGSLTSLKNINKSQFFSDFAYGDTISGSYPLTASISSDHFINRSNKTDD